MTAHEDEWYVIKVRHKITGKVRWTFGTDIHQASHQFRWRRRAERWARAMNRYDNKRRGWVRDE